MSAFPPDIQRALQHAVVEANGVFPQELTQKKKRRKERDVDGDGKKRKKKRSGEEGVAADAADDAVESTMEHYLGSEEVAGTVDSSKKKKRKSHRQEHAQANDPFPIDPQLLESTSTLTNEAPTTAFLSAIVAAANSQQQQQQESYPSMVEPHLSNQGYSSSVPGVYPPPNLLADFSNASNEDILRAIQELDRDKMAEAIRILGEAAGQSSSSAMLPQGHPQIAHQHHPHHFAHAGPSSLLAPPKKVPDKNKKRTLDMSLADSVPTTPHAELLATKWMNAGKLAEMVRTEGLVYKKGKFSAIEEQQVRAAIENYRLVSDSDR